jgi:Succinylglutamate desuccinylase / Aspartoacylase family
MPWRHGILPPMSKIDPIDSGYTLDQFIHGDPVESITATSLPAILIIGLHGDEDLAARVAYYIHTNRPDLLQHVDYICGNPKAATKQIRATTPLADLNRSFRPNGEPSGYEEERAQELMLRMKKYDYVLDVHTSETECGRFFLVADPDDESVRDVIASSSIERIAVLPRQLTDTALIGNVARSIAIEYNEILARKPEATKEIIEIVDGLIGRHYQKKLRQLFIVERAVPKSEDPGDVRNFEMCSDGYYPILFGVGLKSYRNDPSKNYLGFASSKIVRVVL